MVIQLILNREWDLAKNENPNRGAFIIAELTDLVEKAVLKEFEAISERGGVTSHTVQRHPPRLPSLIRSTGLDSADPGKRVSKRVGLSEQ